MDNFSNKYRYYQQAMVPNVSISSRGTYEIEGNSDFAKDLRAVTSITKAHDPIYKPHIPLNYKKRFLFFKLLAGGQRRATKCYLKYGPPLTFQC